MVLKCQGCGKANPMPWESPSAMHMDKPLKRCTKCLGVFYCDATCQLADWVGHKKVCAAMVL
jgi:hypothetical protein